MHLTVEASLLTPWLARHCLITAFFFTILQFRQSAKLEIETLRGQLHALQSQRENLESTASMLTVQKQQQLKLLEHLQQVSQAAK
jgi:hypothetical protein